MRGVTLARKKCYSPRIADVFMVSLQVRVRFFCTRRSNLRSRYEIVPASDPKGFAMMGHDCIIIETLRVLVSYGGEGKQGA